MKNDVKALAGQMEDLCMNIIREAKKADHSAQDLFTNMADGEGVGGQWIIAQFGGYVTQADIVADYAHSVREDLDKLLELAEKLNEAATV